MIYSSSRVRGVISTGSANPAGQDAIPTVPFNFTAVILSAVTRVFAWVCG